MFSRVRRHVNATTILAFLALIFAVTGGAFAAGGGRGFDNLPAKATASAAAGGAVAANHTVATAAKSKTKPKAKTGPRGPAGPAGKNGTNGAPGATGAAGLQGPAGPAGAKGETGATGGEGPKGEPGAKGENGTTGFTKTLPEGETEKGTWAALRTASVAHETVASPISFTIPLANGLSEGHVHYLLAGEKGAGGGCPTGSEASKPEAEPGNLCVFATTEENSRPPEGLAHYAILDPENEDEAFNTGGKTGVAVVSQAVAAGEVRVYGTWAVTAKTK